MVEGGEEGCSTLIKEETIGAENNVKLSLETCQLCGIIPPQHSAGIATLTYTHTCTLTSTDPYTPMSDIRTHMHTYIQREMHHRAT